MKTRITQVFAAIFAAAAFSLLGCSSNSSPSGSASGGTAGGAVTATGGVNSGGSTTSSIASGGAPTSGGTLASGGQVQGGSSAQGGAATGGAATNAGGQPASGGNATGGRATGGSSATGGGETGGSVAGGSVAGGGKTGGGATGGTTTGGTSNGGKTSTGGAAGGTGGTAAGGKTATGGAATGGTATGGTTGTGGATPIGGGKGSSDGTTPITVWMAGDSTMSGSGCDGGGGGDQFGSVFNSNVTVVNKSVAGRSIQTWLYEKNVSSTAGANGECTLTGTTYSDNWNAMLDANTGMKAGDYLFVEFGINDGDGTCPRHVGTTLFQTYLTTMAKAASDRGAQAIFLPSTSAIACNGSTAQANRGFGPQTKAAGTADNVPVIDMTVLTANLYTSVGLCPNSGDYTSTTSKVGQFFCNDHTHFEAAGALQIAQTAAQALKDQGIGLAAYLKN